MKIPFTVLLLGALAISADAQAYAGAAIEAALLEPATPNPTVSQSNPLIEMGITVKPAPGVLISSYQVEIMLTTTDPATNPNPVVVATAEYTPSSSYTEADIDTTALPPGYYWVSADLR
jgi:hypothetical protein